MSAKQKGPQPRLWRLGPLAERAHREAAEKYRAHVERRQLGPVTGLDRLDLLLGKALHVGVHTLHGSPASGKTAFALQVASTCGTPAVVVSCEMTPTVLFYRLTARVCDVHLSSLECGTMHPDIVATHLERAAASAPLLALADGTEAPVPVDWIAQAVEAVRGDERHCLLVVDSLHSLTQACYPDVMEYDALNQGLEELRQLTARMSIACLAICERNRGAMREGGMSAAAGTRRVEYVGQSVIGLDVGQDAPQQDGTRSVKLTLHKNRSGESGKVVWLWWKGSRQRFWEQDAPGGG